MKKFMLGFLCGSIGVITSILVIAEQKPDKWVDQRDAHKKHIEDTKKYVGWITDDRGVE